MKCFRKLVLYLSLTRAYMATIIGITAVCGGYLARNGLNDGQAVLLFIVQFCGAAGGFALNDVLDRDRDRLVVYKPIASGKLSLKEAVAATCIMLFIAMLTSFLLGMIPFCIAWVQLGIVCLYSRIKVWHGFAANMITAGLCASGFLYGAFARHQIGAAWIPAVITLEFILAREIVKDVVDIVPDGIAGLHTVPLKCGMNFSRYIVATLFICTTTISMLPVVRGSFGPGYTMAMLFVNFALFLATLLFFRQPDREGAEHYLVLTAATFPFAIIAFFL